MRFVIQTWYCEALNPAISVEARLYVTFSGNAEVQDLGEEQEEERGHARSDGEG